MIDWDDQPDGTTPLPIDERQGLKISSIKTIGELNELEAANITVAMEWVTRQRKYKGMGYLGREFATELHRRMYGQVWCWAGLERTFEIGFGSDPDYIGVRLHDLLEDARVWVEYDTYQLPEFAARFHHRLVWIHTFPNGNGRHARLYTDVVLERLLNVGALNWHGSRAQYIEALRVADSGDYAPLIEWIENCISF